MGYMQDADRWLDDVLVTLLDGEAVDVHILEDAKRQIREKLLESYRNGLKAREQSPSPRGGSRRPFRQRTQAERNN
jgi:hypothetical protein